MNVKEIWIVMDKYELNKYGLLGVLKQWGRYQAAPPSGCQLTLNQTHGLTWLQKNFKQSGNVLPLCVFSNVYVYVHMT